MEAVKRRKLNESKLNNREESTSPLKVLLIASQPLVDDDQNGNFPLHLPDLKEERNKIQHIFANSGVAVKLHVIAEATFSEVAFALQKKWDIIHFTGHGTQEGASLLLEDGYGKAQHLLKDQLKILAESNASLIFLSACYSERFGAHLVVNDIERAVITIKTDFPIAQDAAIVFAENFYRGLAKGHVVQSAFAVAKQAVAMHPYLCTFENGVQKGTKQMAEKGFPVTDDSDDQQTPYSERFVLLGNSQLHLRKCSVGPCISSGINGKVEGNLVPVKHTMLGRESEIVQIVKSFEKDKSPRVSLYGTGGIGRTELSKAVAWWFVERGRLDTVLFVSASPAEGDHIISDLVSFLFTIIRVFGLPISEGTQLEGIKTAVLRYLADKRSLVIIDQWDMISSKPNLWNFILSLPPNVKVAITSNTPMNPSEVQNIEVMPLSSMNSRKLFWNIIKNAGYFQHRSTLDAQEIMVISNIGDALGGIPLAVEVAASQATKLSLPEIWKRLTSTPHMILETKNDITGTSRGVWTSLGLAFGVLPDAEKDLLTQLSIFQSPFSLEDVVSILDISAIVHTDNPIRDVLNSLLSLISHSFITDCRSVYAMNPVIRQFALYHLKREAVPLHYNAVRHFASSKTLEGMTPISEHLHAVSSYYGQEKASKLFLLYFSALHEEWITQGKWYKTIPIAQKALEAAKKLQDDQWIMYINCCLGDLYTKIGEVAEAHKIFTALAEPGEKMNSPYGVAVAKFYLGILSWTSGDIKAGEIQVQESIDIATVHNLPKRLADATATMGAFAETFGRLEEARALQQEGIRIREGLLEYENETVIYSKNIMALLAGSQSATEVDDLFSKSLNLVLNAGLWRGIIDSMARLSIIEHALGNQHKALEMIHYALNIATSRKYEMGVFTLLSKLGSVRLSEKNYKEAQKLFEQSLQKVKKIGSSWETVHTQVSLAMTHAKLGQIPTATELLEEVIELAERTGYKQGLFRALTTLATMDFEANNFILALPVFKECLKIKEVTSKKDEAITCAYVGKCYLAENLLKKARKYLSRSLTAYDQAGSATLPEREEIRILLDSCQDHY